MKIGAYNYTFNKQVKLISRYHSVLLVDKIVGTSEYKFTHCNETDVQSDILPTYKTDALYVSTINLLPNSKQAVITSDTWRHINDIQITKCDVQHLTADTATVKTNTDDDENFITTKYFIDWQKCNAFIQTKDQITDDGLNQIGHLTTKTKIISSNYMLGVFGKEFGGAHKHTFVMGGVKANYTLGYDGGIFDHLAGCGFVVGVDPISDETSSDVDGFVECVGFRKKYIVEITNKQLNI